MKMILLGAPGAGKGTQAQRLCQVLDIPSVSTGNILRQAVKDGTPTGKAVSACIDAGQLVPDDLIVDLVHQRLGRDDCRRGYILDGVPRTIPQGEALERWGIVFDHVVSIEISDEAVVERMAGRRVCRECGASFHLTNLPPKTPGVCDVCGGALVQRRDDAPQTVKERLALYHRETEPLKAFYQQRGLLRTVEDRPTADETLQAILQAVGRGT